MKYRKFKTPEQLAADDKLARMKEKKVTHVFAFDESKLKPIPDLPNHFACENGGIYSNKLNKIHNKVRFRQVKTYQSGSGSCVVKLTMPDGTQKQHSVARLLALTFLGEPKHENMRVYKIDISKPLIASNIKWGMHKYDN